ncbi:MAG: hypothetical protein V1722_01990 [Candidatus Micrarchaeota archaeon]
MKIVFLGGPRGAGKSTLINKVSKEFPEVHTFHLKYVLLHANAQGISPEEYVTRVAAGKKVVLIDGKFANTPSNLRNLATASYFQDGAGFFPSASKFVFMSAPEKVLNERMKNDKKKRKQNPRALLAEWTAMRLFEKPVEHIDSTDQREAHRALRKIVLQEMR